MADNNTIKDNEEDISSTTAPAGSKASAAVSFENMAGGTATKRVSAVSRSTSPTSWDELALKRTASEPGPPRLHRNSSNSNLGGGGSRDGDIDPPSALETPNRKSFKRGVIPFLGGLWVLVGHLQCMNSTRLMVLAVLCFQNSIFTVLRRYSQGVLRESYSKHELLLVAEIIKIVFSGWMISKGMEQSGSNDETIMQRLRYLVMTSKKMFVLALIYGAMNILSFISLRNISAGMFTIFAQCKILTTATFSSLILRRQYSWAKWRALISLMLGVLLFSEPIWGDPAKQQTIEGANAFIGTFAVLTEVVLSGFASIYFEKVIKTDPLQLNIWERNFQLALGSFPVYMAFIISDKGGQAGFLGGWSWVAFLLALLGAAGGLLVALSIKYGDSILKTLATTGAIILSSALDHALLDGPLTPSMAIAGAQVIISICNYTFDTTPDPPAAVEKTIPDPRTSPSNDEEDPLLFEGDSHTSQGQR